MKVTASVATSLDGCMDDTSPQRLRLSSEEDWLQVQQLRASCDAIMVGAGTVRKDNPSLVIRDPEVRRAREAAGHPADLVKVTISSSLDLDPQNRFFTEGEGRKIIFVPAGSAAALKPAATRAATRNGTAAISTADISALQEVADVVPLPQLTPRAVVEALATMGYASLIVEGGAKVLREFFAAGVVEKLRLAVAPVTVGEPLAPHFDLPHNLLLRSEYMAGETAVYEYDVARTDEELLLVAVRESEKCTPVKRAYSVGAVIVTRTGEVFKGFSRETGQHNHAEEEAIAKALSAGATLKGAAIYSSMEPCSERSSKAVSCSEHIINHRFDRVVYALCEPEHFVRCHSLSLFKKVGIEVIIIDKYANMVKNINRHIV